MPTPPARGLHGDYTPAPGDLTGHRHLANLADKEDREAALVHTINSLREDAVVLLPEPGGASWVVTKHVVELLRSAFERGVL